MDVPYKFSLGMVRFSGGSPSTMQEFVESTGRSRLGRVDSSRDVMEIPCWGVAIFRLEEQGHKENERNILWNLVEFRFL